MQNIQKKEAVISSNPLEVLPQYPQAAANTLKPLLQRATMHEYKHFLYMMYHYTKDSANKLIYAADCAETDELKAYFIDMSREERGHYLLAQRDYEALGLEMDTENKPGVVEEFDNFWYSLGKQDFNEFVGALYVFESVADLVGNEVAALVKRLKLSKTQARWLNIHIEADHDHGKEALNMCEKYIDRNPNAMIKAADAASKRWSAVFVEAFS